jgi:hypothetical protein
MIDKYSAQDILLITAITNLHVGTGKEEEVVDLPIQRNSHGLSTICFSSSEGANKSYIYSKEGRVRTIKYMKKREFVLSLFTYPIISFLITFLTLLSIIIISYVNYGFIALTFKDVLLTLVIVFSTLTVTGMLDGSFYDSNIGLFFAKHFHLIDKNRLGNLVYETEIKGRIAKGAETIEMALTVIGLIIYIHG